ncbi:hypothetical protein M407DRAFT_25160 [Tulasnella calospora MUT 4182]|uniref:Retrovirus-related Pol polyprotein from transposon TNT 1-94-like beta-barrel domain-containing protein n=1 Tax=Tulasnella calospora MUT 4182 TaxID=1051891 RepID=A0A0C3QGI8_9AGAM|nr:hypothetical protein M407DRAFT_25160 [Tulasnella calospora MUT 4182]
MAKFDLTKLTTMESYPDFARETRIEGLSKRVWKHINTSITAPAQSSPPTDKQLEALAAHDENEEQALGIILERLDAANFRLDANRQYQLYQSLASIKQEPNESLPAYLERLELAGNRLNNSLPTGTTPSSVISMLITFLAVQNLDPTEDNEKFELNLSIAGKITSATITEAFSVEQTCRDIAIQTKESGLAARTGRPPKRGPKPDSPTCAHCQKAHKSEDCYSKYPEKMPQWMKGQNEEQHRRRAQQQQPKGTSASRATTAEPVNESKSETVSMASSTSSSPTPSADMRWITDLGATSSMTPHCHWIRNLTPCRVQVSVASGDVVYAVGKGEVLFQPQINGVEVESVLFSQVLYVPQLQNSLFAVLPVARKRDIVVSFDRNKVHFQSTQGDTFMTASYKDKTAYLDGKTIPAGIIN